MLLFIMEVDLPDHSSQKERMSSHDHKSSHAYLLLGGRSIPQYILQDNRFCWQSSEKSHYLIS